MVMKILAQDVKARYVLCVLAFVTSIELDAQQKELRGVWYTPRTSGGFVSQAQIAAAMDTIANNNFNTVFFLVWSQGYPLWRSKVFYDATGGRYWTDPRAGNRDLLAEAITEAHRRGLEIEAWFEYGFVGGYSGNRPPGSERGPLLDRNPSWRGRARGGGDTISIGGGQHHYWMSHLHSGVRQFLIGLAAEVVRNYDVDGFELDRIRYPQLDWGYDSATVAVYRAERGTDPPDPQDAGWKRWRADKLNQFHRDVYDTLKRINPRVLVTNAPSHYSSSSYYSSYESFCQDWTTWLNDGAVDALHVQMYVGSSLFPNYLNALSQYRVTDPVKRQRIFPGIAPAPAGARMSASDFLSIISTTRNAGYQGNAIWYYEDLGLTEGGRTYWSHLKSSVYQQPAHTPLRAQTDWRKPAILINDLDAAQVDTTGAWLRNVNLPGYFGPTLQTSASGSSSITYYASVETAAWYDVFAYVVGHQFRTTRAPYDVFDSSGVASRVLVNQSDPVTRGWVHLGTKFFRAGRQRVFRLSNEGIESNLAVAGGGGMLILNRRLSPDAITSVKSESLIRPRRIQLFPAYPNPFNSSTTVSFRLPRPEIVSLDAVDVLGRRVASVLREVPRGAGEHVVHFAASDLTSGIYFLRLTAGDQQMTTRVVLIR